MDVIRLAWKELKRKRIRTFGNMLGFFIASSAMVVLISLLNLSSEAQGSVLSTTGTHYIAFVPYISTDASTCSACTLSGKPVNDGKLAGFIADNDYTNIMPLSLVESIQQFSEVKDVSAGLWFRTSNNGTPQTLAGFHTSNRVSVRTTCCAPSDIVEGRFFNEGETGSVLVEERYAHTQSIRVGDDILVSGLPFHVIGLVNAGVRPVKADVYMDFNDASLCAGKVLGDDVSGYFNILMVEAKDAHVHDLAIEKTKLLIGKHTAISSYKCYKPAAKVLGMNDYSVWLITGLIGAAAILLSMKTLFSSVIERRHDIAILKAIGWSDAVIMMQIFTESLLQAIIGGLAGCMAGVMVLFALPLNTFTDTYAKIEIDSVVWISLISIVLTLAGGILAGLLPALRTIGEKPAAVLRRV